MKSMAAIMAMTAIFSKSFSEKMYKQPFSFNNKRDFEGAIKQHNKNRKKKKKRVK